MANEITSQTEIEQADKLEEEALAQPDVGVYTHALRKPFTWEGRTVERLTFDWDSLTGRDYAAIEDEMALQGKNLLVPAYSGHFLCGMAVRACTERDKDKRRVVDKGFLQGLPLREYQAILGKARSFLLRLG